jgi:aryl-alcohol dehydrogenase-like predicted oxidoreductase
LIQLALGFVLSHRAVTSAIIGPRVHEQLESQLPAIGVRLEDQLLDRIDQLVAPGTTLNPEDVGWTPPALTDPRLRRAPSGR